MPGFTAEASLYESRRRYRSHSALNDAGRTGTHALVAPQACGAFKSLACNGLILGCVGCTAFFPNVPAMVGCFAACLGGFYGYCRECIDVLDDPENGGQAERHREEREWQVHIDHAEQGRTDGEIFLHAAADFLCGMRQVRSPSTRSACALRFIHHNRYSTGNRNIQTRSTKCQ